MKKNLYIIPGLGETCRRRPYQSIAKIARKKGYEVVFAKVDWKKNLSPQMFAVEKDSVVFGFSLGAVLARLIAQKNPCRKLLLASMTPLHCFKGGEMRRALVELLGSRYVRDVEINLKPKHKARKQVILYGDKEEEKADILVANTEHSLSENYIKEITKLL